MWEGYHDDQTATRLRALERITNGFSDHGRLRNDHPLTSWPAGLGKSAFRGWVGPPANVNTGGFTIERCFRFTPRHLNFESKSLSRASLLMLADHRRNHGGTRQPTDPSRSSCRHVWSDCPTQYRFGLSDNGSGFRCSRLPVTLQVRVKSQ